MPQPYVTRNTPVTEKLFGQDLNGSMKQVAEAFKAGRKLTYSESNKRAPEHQRYAPYTPRSRGIRHGYNAGRVSRDQPYGRSATPSYYANTHSGNRRGTTFGRHRAKSAMSSQDGSGSKNWLVLDRSCNYTCASASAGPLRLFFENWSRITSDRWILNTMSGCKIDFVRCPVQMSEPRNIAFSNEEILAVNK